MPANKPLRVAIIDHHPVSRCACRALLLSEGVEVVADISPDDEAGSMIEALIPDLVIIDISRRLPDVDALVARMRQLRCAIVLTSSAPHPPGSPALGGLAFVAKADLCRSAITEALK